MFWCFVIVDSCSRFNPVQYTRCALGDGVVIRRKGRRLLPLSPAFHHWVIWIHCYRVLLFRMLRICMYLLRFIFTVGQGVHSEALLLHYGRGCTHGGFVAVTSYIGPGLHLPLSATAIGQSVDDPLPTGQYESESRGRKAVDSWALRAGRCSRVV